MTVRTWAPGDTDTAFGWFAADPELWTVCALAPGPITTFRNFILRLLHKQQAGGAHLRAVTVDGTLGAFVAVDPVQDTVGTVHLVVAPQYRGHGPDMARAGFDAAKAAGLTRLVAPLKSDAARALVSRVGFTYQGELWAKEL